MCLRDFDDKKLMLFFHRHNFKPEATCGGVSIGIFFILILFKQLLSDKIFLGQEKN
jgi:hypothetical protein